MMTDAQAEAVRSQGLQIIRTMMGNGPGKRHLIVLKPGDTEAQIMDTKGRLHTYVPPLTPHGSVIVKPDPADLPAA